MKKLSIFLTILLPITTFGQLVVSDPGVNSTLAQQSANLLKQSVEAVKQTDFLAQSVNFLDDAQKKLAKVNSFILDIETVKNISQDAVTNVKYYSYYMDNSKKFSHISTQQMRLFTNNLSCLLSDSKAMLAMAQKVLSSNYFNMSDDERMTKLENLDDKLVNNIYLMQISYNELLIEENSKIVHEVINN